MRHYTINRADRAAIPVRQGQLVYSGNDCYGVASDDSRVEGIEHRAMSTSATGEPFFTIPSCDVSPSPPYGYAGIP